MLRAAVESFVDPAVYYNRREKKGSEAELGYFLAHGSRVVPLEVTAGATGSLKALHHFMHRRQLLLAVRINADPISATPRRDAPQWRRYGSVYAALNSILSHRASQAPAA